MDLSPFSPSPPRTAMPPRLAILIDGDNVPRTDLAQIAAEARLLGDPVVRRVYADMGLRKDWAVEGDYLTVHCSTAKGKNRADIHLVIGAMDIAHRGLATAFLIVSDDRDFGPLTSYLQEIGMQVRQIGKPRPMPVPAAATQRLTEVDQRLHTHLKDSKKGLSLLQIGLLMRNGTVKSQTGKKTWREYLRGLPDLYRLEGERSLTLVTLKA